MSKVIFGHTYHTVQEAAQLMESSTYVIRKLAKAGEIECKRLGQRNYIPERSLKNYLGVTYILNDEELRIEAPNEWIEEQATFKIN